MSATHLEYGLAALVAATNRSLTQKGLRVSDWAVLLHLVNRGGLKLQELSAAANLHKATTSRSVRRLCIRGYVTLSSAARSGPSYCIGLSPKGTAFVQRLVRNWSAAELLPGSPLELAELEALARLLEKVVEAGQNTSLAPNEASGDPAGINVRIGLQDRLSRHGAA